MKRAWRSVLFKRSDLNGFLIYTFDGEGDAVHITAGKVFRSAGVASMDCDKPLSKSLVFFHAFGCASAWFGGAAENGVIAAFLASMFYFVMFAFAGANHGDRAFASGTHVLLANGHYFDVAFLGVDVVQHHGLAHAANHGKRVTWLKGFRLGGSCDLFHHYLAAFHTFRSGERVGEPADQGSGDCQRGMQGDYFSDDFG